LNPFCPAEPRCDVRIPLPIILAASLLAPGAYAANWQVVVHERDKRVDIDRSRVGRIEGGKHVAWSRVALPVAATDATSGRRYAIVEMLSHYDCAVRTFAVVRRVFVGTDDIPIREERSATAEWSAVPAGTHDEKLLDQVCASRKPGAAVAARAAEVERPAPPKSQAVTVPVAVSAAETAAKPAAGGVQQTESRPPLRVAEGTTRDGKRQVSALALQIAEAASLAAAQAQRDAAPAAKREHGR
jgi:carbonic anhydrase